MKLGQIVKDVLDQLNKQVWVKKTLDGFERYYLEVNVDPRYASAVNILIYAGLAELGTHFHVQTDENLFLQPEKYLSLRLISPYEKKPEDPSKTDFIKNLAAGIDTYVKKLSKDWRDSNESEENLLISGSYFIKSNQNVILEHDFILIDRHLYSGLGIYLDSENLMHTASRMFVESNPSYVLEEKQSQGRTFLTIPLVPKNYDPSAEHIQKNFIVGKKDVVSKFVEALAYDLSPIDYERLVEAKEEPRLKQNKPLAQTFTQSKHIIFNSKNGIEEESSEHDYSKVAYGIK